MASVEPVDVVVGAGSGMGAAVAATLQGDRPLLVVDQDGEEAQRTADALGPGAEAAVRHQPPPMPLNPYPFYSCRSRVVWSRELSCRRAIRLGSNDQ
jgi:NAD(P)-dependent dehydrogenase (short-subunit alcohol dehydrogenase family)